MIKTRRSGGYVSTDDFKRLDMRVGKIVSVDRLPKAEKLYRI